MGEGGSWALTWLQIPALSGLQGERRGTGAGRRGRGKTGEGEREEEEKEEEERRACEKGVWDTL